MLAVSFLPAISLLWGCSDGPQRAAVSGTVKLNGQLVAEGSISFIPTEGTVGPEVGAIIKNGQYHIPRDKGVIVGTNRVELRAIQKLGTMIQDPTKPQGELTEKLGEAFPPECNSESKLIRNVQAVDNTFDFAVNTKDGDRPQ
jgi:hypothetical protein